MRQARAILRKLASKARNQGKTVYQHDDYIIIDGQKFDLQNASQSDVNPTYAYVASGKIPKVNSMEGKAKDQLNKPKGYKLPAGRKTRIGLAFFTSESKKSCFHPIGVSYEGVAYQTPEHTFQCMKALTSEMMDLYHKIKEAPTPRRAKELGGEVPYNPEWERIKPDVMFKIQLKKQEQHPELGEDLCANDGIFMEASRDRYWGTGVTIMDPSLDDGKFPGRNELGSALDKVKDILLARRTVNMPDAAPKNVGHLAPQPSIVRQTMFKVTALSELGHSKPAAARLNTAQTVDTTTTILSSGERVVEPNKIEKHSLEIEVLETNIPITTRTQERVWEPNIIFKEGTIVV